MNEAVEIPLTRGKVALVSPQDAELVLQFKWYAQRDRNTWYAHGRALGNRQFIRMHRLILDAPGGMVVDHIDDNGLNNTRENLRLCTIRQNSANRRHQKNTTGYRGVYRRPNCVAFPYMAVITVNKERLYLGTFSDPKVAAYAFDDAAREHLGEFARLNFPEYQHRDNSE